MAHDKSLNDSLEKGSLLFKKDSLNFMASHSEIEMIVTKHYESITEVLNLRDGVNSFEEFNQVLNKLLQSCVNEQEFFIVILKLSLEYPKYGSMVNLNQVSVDFESAIAENKKFALTSIYANLANICLNFNVAGLALSVVLMGFVLKLLLNPSSDEQILDYTMRNTFQTMSLPLDKQLEFYNFFRDNLNLEKIQVYEFLNFIVDQDLIQFIDFKDNTKYFFSCLYDELSVEMHSAMHRFSKYIRFEKQNVLSLVGYFVVENLLKQDQLDELENFLLERFSLDDLNTEDDYNLATFAFLFTRNDQLLQNYLEDHNSPIVTDLFTLNDLDYLTLSRKVELFLINPEKFLHLITETFHPDSKIYTMLLENIQKGLSGDDLFKDQQFLEQLSLDKLLMLDKYVKYDLTDIDFIPPTVLLSESHLEQAFIKDLLIRGRYTLLRFKNLQAEMYFVDNYLFANLNLYHSFNEYLTHKNISELEYFGQYSRDQLSKLIYDSNNEVNENAYEFILVNRSLFDESLVNSISVSIDANDLTFFAAKDQYLIDLLRDKLLEFSDGNLNIPSYSTNQADVISELFNTAGNDFMFLFLSKLSEDTRFLLLENFPRFLRLEPQNIFKADSLDYFNVIFTSGQFQFGDSQYSRLEMKHFSADQFDEIYRIVSTYNIPVEYSDEYLNYLLHKFFEGNTREYDALMDDEFMKTLMLDPYMLQTLNSITMGKVNSVFQLVFSEFPSRIVDVITKSVLSVYIYDFSFLNFNSEFDSDLSLAKDRYGKVSFELFCILVSRYYGVSFPLFESKDFPYSALEHCFSFFDTLSVPESDLNLENLDMINHYNFSYFQKLVDKHYSDQKALSLIFETLLKANAEDFHNSRLLGQMLDYFCSRSDFSRFDLLFTSKKVNFSNLNLLNPNIVASKILIHLKVDNFEAVIFSLSDINQKKLFEWFEVHNIYSSKLSFKDSSLSKYVDSPFYLSLNKLNRISISSHVYSESEYQFLFDSFMDHGFCFEVDLNFARFLIKKLSIIDEDAKFHLLRDILNGGDAINLFIAACESSDIDLINLFARKIGNEITIDDKNYSKFVKINSPIVDDIKLVLEKIGFIDKFITFFILKKHFAETGFEYKDSVYDYIIPSGMTLENILDSYDKINKYNRNPLQDLIFESDLERYLFLLSYGVFTAEWGKLSFSHGMSFLKRLELIDPIHTQVKPEFTESKYDVDFILESQAFCVNDETLAKVAHLQDLVSDFDLSDWIIIEEAFDKGLIAPDSDLYPFYKALVARGEFNPCLDFELLNSIDLFEQLKALLSSFDLDLSDSEIQELLELKPKTVIKKYGLEVSQAVLSIKNLKMNMLSELLSVNISLDRNAMKTSYIRHFKLSDNQVMELNSLIGLDFREAQKRISDKKLLGHLNAFNLLDSGYVFELLSIDIDNVAFTNFKDNLTLALIKFCVSSIGSLGGDAFDPSNLPSLLTSINLSDLYEREWKMLDESVRYLVEDYLKQIFSDSKVFSVVKKMLAYDTLSQIKSSEKVIGGVKSFEIHPLRDLSLEFSGQLVGACWANKYREGVAPAMDNVTFYRFGTSETLNTAMLEDDGTDVDIYSLLGGTMLVEGFDTNGEKLLIVRGFNPTIDCLQTFFAESVVHKFLTYLHTVASKFNAKVCIIIDGCNAASTNRPEVFGVYTKLKPHLTKVEVDTDRQSIVFNGYDKTHLHMYEVTLDVLDKFDEIFPSTKVKS